MGVFSVPVFFVIFRETFEAGIIVSVLLTFIHQVFSDPLTLKRLSKQVWLGTALGLSTSLLIGGIFITIFYLASKNLWDSNELAWEGGFSLIASLLIGTMSFAMIKSCDQQEKWKLKLANSIEADSSEGFASRYALVILPFVTVLREGVEGMLIMGGVALGADPSSIPAAAAAGVLLGCIVGYLVYKGGNHITLKWFFVASTCLLLLMGSGLFARGIYLLEAYAWSSHYDGIDPDMAYVPIVDVRSTLWYLRCCDPRDRSMLGWQIFEALLGWRNVATLGTIIGYCSYWLAVVFALTVIKKQKHAGARSNSGGGGTASASATAVDSLDIDQSFAEAGDASRHGGNHPSDDTDAEQDDDNGICGQTNFRSSSPAPLLSSSEV